jgi:hypothetical protein
MTSAQLEHLRKIDAHLEKLLSQAEKRTPGRWATRTAQREVGQSGEFETETWITAEPDHCITNGWNLEDEDSDNFTYIASCAGNAEAGWKATRAAIAGWLSLYKATEGYADGAPDASAHDKLCNEVASLCRTNLRHILAAFPLELIEG